MKPEEFISYDKEFDLEFAYEGKDLGASCTEEGSIFKVWSPLADRIELHLYKDDASEEYETQELTPLEKGVWKWETKENLHGTYYDYTVYRGGKGTQAADPYAIACGCNGIRSMVVDLRQTDPDNFAEDKAPAQTQENIIYELHIKDFSHDPDSGIPEQYRGKYKAFTVKGTNGEYPTCMEYLKELGVTHVHLLPFYDFGHTEEDGDPDQFNWGYDPINYNVPEGTFATDPHDGTVRIRECKEMIQALHENGIRVVMDVVYNHTYEPDSWMERIVPGYYNRRWKDGSLANGSACGSDMAAGRAMVDNYIADSVMYWAKEYHIDGFRFDLMGLLTVELMNRIRKELDEEFGAGEKILYGEPWRAEESPMEEGTRPALKDNIEYLDEGIAIFSDDTRDVIKGHVFEEEIPGFVNGAEDLEETVLGAVTGWCGETYNVEGFRPKSCAQIIQYVSAHDNFTLWDKLVITMQGKDADFTKPYENVMKANKLSAFIYFTCQGHLFMQAGEEYGRTKLGDENSYRSHPTINMLRWHQTVENADLLNYYKGLIQLRKQLPGLCDKTAAAPARVSEQTVQGKDVVSFVVDNHIAEGQKGFAELTESWEKLFICYNASGENVEVEVPAGEWMVLADAQTTNCRKKDVCKDGKIVVEAGSGIVLGKC